MLPSCCDERCLCGSGGGEEQAAAATVFALLCIQLGGGDEAEEGFKILRPVLTTILIDNGASLAARQSVSPPSFHCLDIFHTDLTLCCVVVRQSSGNVLLCLCC